MHFIITCVFAVYRLIWWILSVHAHSRWKKVTPKDHDELEILFEDLQNFQFIDSGGQGAVYRAEHQGRIVAVKKVRDPKELELKHLLKLKHE